MTSDRTANGECDSRERGDDSVGDEPGRDVTHQSLREEKRVESPTDDADYGSDTTVEQIVLIAREASREDILVQRGHHNDSGDGRDLR